MLGRSINMTLSRNDHGNSVVLVGLNPGHLKQSLRKSKNSLTFLLPFLNHIQSLWSCINFHHDPSLWSFIRSVCEFDFPHIPSFYDLSPLNRPRRLRICNPFLSDSSSSLLKLRLKVFDQNQFYILSPQHSQYLSTHYLKSIAHNSEILKIINGFCCSQNSHIESLKSKTA